MIIFNSVSEMRQAASAWRAEGKTIALVSTSGTLHEGHRAMIRAAREKAQIVLVSLFVNPLQFGPNEHYSSYPRPSADDMALCEAEGVQAVFMPSAEELFPRGFSTYVIEDSVSKPLCGISRPAHFRGVTTALAKLLNLVQPNFLIMGLKDAQTVAVARKMIADLCFNTELFTVPVVRDPDGLSCHVRNRELTSIQRQEALTIPQAMQQAKEMVAGGQRSVDRVVAEVTHLLRQHRRIRVVYVSIVDPLTMEVQREVTPGGSLLALSAWVDEVRLTDNTLL